MANTVFRRRMRHAFHAWAGAAHTPLTSGHFLHSLHADNGLLIRHDWCLLRRAAHILPLNTSSLFSRHLLYCCFHFLRHYHVRRWILLDIVGGWRLRFMLYMPSWFWLLISFDIFRLPLIAPLPYGFRCRHAPLLTLALRLGICVFSAIRFHWEAKPSLLLLMLPLFTLLRHGASWPCHAIEFVAIRHTLKTHYCLCFFFAIAAAYASLRFSFSRQSLIGHWSPYCSPYCLFAVSLPPMFLISMLSVTTCRYWIRHQFRFTSSHICRR